MKLIKRKKPIRFGIKMATCNRKKWLPVKEMIAQTLESLMNQTYTDWRLFLIGDKYEPHEEFVEISKMIPPEKITAVNLRGHTPERERWAKYPKIIEKIGGFVATNFCLDLIWNSGIRYVANLDDDDLWFPEHLELMADAYRKIPAPAMVCSMSNYRYQRVLPHIVAKEDGTYGLPSLDKNVNHSAVSWDMKKIPLRYQNRIHETAWQPDFGDADMWARMENFCKKNGHVISLVPRVTVEYR